MNKLIGIGGQIKAGKDLTGLIITYIQECVEHAEEPTFINFEKYKKWDPFLN